jgi:glutamate-5-semialdehyde dehydrogenase
MDIQQTFDMAQAAAMARVASRQVAQLSSKQKNRLLLTMAEKIEQSQQNILNHNQLDIDAGKANELSDAMLDRLLLTPKRINDIASALREIVTLTDPIGEVNQMVIRPNGMQVGKMRIPLGVIAMIYEARPNVTAEAAALCIKSGNAVILRGGSEAINSNLALAACLHQALLAQGLDPNIVTVIPDTSRAVIGVLLQQRESIDLVIPRGGEGLIRYVTMHSQIPVIQHFKGVCHLYVDRHADLAKAVNILVNGKTQRPSACNALETLLVHSAVAQQFLPLAAQALTPAQVKVHACSNSLNYFSGALPATEQDYQAEYLAQEIAVKVVDDYAEAIAHIEQYSSNHTEVIVSQDYSRAHDFVKRINASVVMINASSRFSDGGQLGLGSEIGISTSKLHAYGPMGLTALTTEKFVVFGDGQIRD